MNQRKLALSIALGALLTLGVLAAFGLNHDLALASPDTAQVDHQPSRVKTIRSQDTISTAHVVVQFGEHDTIVHPISFSEPISGLAALQLAGLDVTIADTAFGPALCAIEGVGCPADDCFCGGSTFWNYLHWDQQDWSSYSVGIGDSAVEHNDVEGYAWGEWGTTPPPAPQLIAAADALDWLRRQQRIDGSFGTVNDTVETLLAISANGLDGTTWRHSPSLLANVLSTGTEFANRNAAGAGKLAVALTAQEACYPIGADRPLDHYDASKGAFSPDTLYQGWGIIGAATLGESVPISAMVSLKDNQQDNGGWELFKDFGADTNATALALQALIAAGEPVTSTSVVSGLAYLEGAQNDDGGFPYSPDSPWGTDSDTNSTAYVVQALYAAGEDPLTGPWAVADGDPISYLLSMQLPDGSFEWQEGFGSNQLATQQAIPALLHRSYPMRVTALDSCYGISGRVVSAVGGSENPMPGVRLEADGADDLFFGITDESGTYTLSVPAAETYTVTPSRDRFTFTPTIQTVDVSETPGDVTLVPDFAGQTRVYLPLTIRD